MIVGVPKEIKQDEYRVAMLPVGVEELVRAGTRCSSKREPARVPGLPDSDYVRRGRTDRRAGGDLRAGRHDCEGEGAAARGDGH